METIKRFLSQVKDRYSKNSYRLIKEALRFAIKYDTKSKRYNGDPFYFHSIGVASIVMEELELGSTSVISALLHDVIRLGTLSLVTVEETFSKDHVEVLKGLNNISTVETKESDTQIEHFKELIVSYSTNPRIILIKLADRLEVMRALDNFPKHKVVKKAWETLHLYSQLAHKLGLYKMKSEMEDLSLKFLEPIEYEIIERKLAETAEERENFINTFTSSIVKELDKVNFKYTIKGRAKSIYSIWRKMHKQHVTFDEVYDVFAIRIVIDCSSENEKAQCWHTFSIVTDCYKHNTERMRDWISIPKSNGYESLHATVVTDEGKWVEVQIRTLRMDDIAESGIAAHWRYKGVEGVGLNSEQWLSRLREMMESVDIEGDSLKFETDAVLGTDEVFVFTPTGDIRKLRKGATILDFAFDIHSDLGSKCVGGRVNHKNVAIKEVLKNGDLVEISTLKSQKPKTDWLNIVVTSKARSRIKFYLREEETKMAKLGREELERKVKNWKLPLEIETSGTVLMKYYKQKSVTDIYGMIASDKVSMSEVKEILTKHVNGDLSLKVTEERIEKIIRKKPENSSDCLIIDQTLKGIEYKLAKCCNPIFGDEIFGFVTVLGGITVHRQDCVNGYRLKDKFSYRVIDAAWSSTQASGVFSAKIVVESIDVLGLEHSIRDVLKELKIPLRSMNMSYAGDIVTTIITVEVSSISMLDSVIYRVVKINGITKVYRASGATKID